MSGLIRSALRQLTRLIFRINNAIHVLEALTESAKHIRKEKCPLKQTTIDAVLVAFINYVGLCFRCDYALYTSDLVK